MTGFILDPKLKEFATTKQQALYLDAVNEHGGYRAAADALGISQGGVSDRIARLKMHAALAGYAPEQHLTRPIAPGLKMRGTSQLYRRGEAEPVLEWVKTSADEEMRKLAMRAAAEAMAEDLPRLLPVGPPGITACELLNLYTLTDSHVGMLAWHKESGEDWDLKIAEDTLVRCFQMMIERSPPAKVGFVNQLGDFLHSDGLVPITPTSGHVLDQDGRFSKMVGTVIRVLRRVVDMALARHGHVVVLLAEGNHDMAGSVWLRHMFAALYENEPRITVIDSEMPYYTHRHGVNMLAFHHGHLRKNDQLPILFASQFPALWGATTKRYCHTGHRHHVEEKEHSGMTVFQHPTLAARDAYASRAGYVAERQVTALTYHDRWGEVARNTVTPLMLSDVFA